MPDTRRPASEIAHTSGVNQAATDDSGHPTPFSYQAADRISPITLRFGVLGPNAYTTMIEDWEIGMLFFHCVWDGDSDERALQKVKEKYLGDVLNQQTRDVSLLVGTRGVHPNWLIIGVYNPPKQPDAGQQSYLDMA